jgi:hypothetical protein
MKTSVRCVLAEHGQEIDLERGERVVNVEAAPHGQLRVFIAREQAPAGPRKSTRG